MLYTGQEKKKGTENLIRVQFPSHPKYISVIRNLIYHTSVEEGFTMYDSADLKLIVGEAILNIIKHAYNNETDRPIFLEVKLFKDKMEIRIKDFGIKGKLSVLKPYDVEDYREEGLGLFLIKKLTDHYSFENNTEGENIIVLIKKK